MLSHTHVSSLSFKLSSFSLIQIVSSAGILQRVRRSRQQSPAEERSPSESLWALHRRDFQSSARRSVQVLHGEFALHEIPSVEESRAEFEGNKRGSVVRTSQTFRFLQQLTMNDFSVLRIIGRGGFGEVYGCRKVDTGKMYAMKCLDKKRIKMKQGETLALNERTMLSLVSTGEDCPFIVCMTYAFHTPSKLCFILDLMNGGDLHYHLSQHGVFNETNMKFYATEIILGLEHMHRRWAPPPCNETNLSLATNFIRNYLFTNFTGPGRLHSPSAIFS